jgi:hypothetical protein
MVFGGHTYTVGMADFSKRIPDHGEPPPDALIEVQFDKQVVSAYPRASDLEAELRMIFEDDNPELMDHLVWEHTPAGGVRCFASDMGTATRVCEVARMLADLIYSDEH